MSIELEGVAAHNWKAWREVGASANIGEVTRHIRVFHLQMNGLDVSGTTIDIADIRNKSICYQIGTGGGCRWDEKAKSEHSQHSKDVELGHTVGLHFFLQFV